jgi:hypothetical protein
MNAGWTLLKFVQGKRQGYLHACYEGVLGSGGNAAIILNLGTRCR